MRKNPTAIKLKEVKDVFDWFDMPHKQRWKRIKIEYVNPLDLEPNSYNPNIHDTVSIDLLTKSIGHFGFTQPIVVRKGTNVIIDGEHRWRVSTVLNLDSIPVVYIELTDEEMVIATIIHNRARGHEDKELINKLKKNSFYEQILLEDRDDNR